MSLPTKTSFDPASTLIDQSGHATQLFRDYMVKVDQFLNAIRNGNAPTLTNAANDAAAAAAGVAVGALYRNGSVVQQRQV